MHQAARDDAPTPASEPMVVKTKYTGLAILRTAKASCPSRLPAIRLLARVDAITPPMDKIAGSSARRKISDMN